MAVITLRVSVPECHDGVMVFVTGNCSELGCWSPQAAKPMTFVSSEDGSDIWSVTVQVSVAHLEYRYFTASVLQSFSSSLAGNCGSIVAIQNWESGKMPRVVELSGVPVNCDSDEYGVYGGVSSVSRGWLTEQSEICLSVHGQEGWLKADTASEAEYRIKCEPAMRSTNNSGTRCDGLRQFSPVYVAKFTDDGLHQQAVNGISFNAVNDYITFKVQTCSLKMVAFKFILYSGSDDCDTANTNEIGVAFYQMVTTDKPDVANIPVISSQQQIVGTLRVNCVVVNPMENLPMDLHFSPERWDKPPQSLNIGHRGLGKSYIKDVSSARVPENTILSFSEAAKHGADMVEFDVMLTSDNIPVIFHDFKASVNLTSVDGERSHSLKVPLTDLTFHELNSLNVTKLQDSATSGANRKEDERPFPTLQQCFETIDPSLKFNIEIKYCMHLLRSGQYEEDIRHFPERNHYIDVILCDVFQHAGDREILFSCFDPDVCTMLRAKQTRYPVAFVSQGDTVQYESYQDWRAATLQMAVSFANVESLTGVVLHTEGLLKNIQLIDLAHSRGLSVFCWGEENNDVDTIKLLRRHMLDGIIYDRVDEFMHAVKMDQGH